MTRSLNIGLALGCALNAGFFAAFSHTVMPALRRSPPPASIVVMQAINVVVLNRWFLAIFFGTGLGCVVAVFAALLRWRDAGAAWMLAGALSYLIGTIGVTIACNVPRNHALALVEPASRAGAASWAGYVVGWTAWNHVRTAASFAAAVAFLLTRWQP